MKLLLFLWMIIPCLGSYQEVIDLGKLEIEGKIRGPEVHLIDSSQISSQSAGQLIRWQLETLERELLKPDPPPTTSNVRARARIISHLGHRILGSSLNDPHSQNPRHIDGYASDFAQSARPNLTPSCAPKCEIILARALSRRKR